MGRVFVLLIMAACGGSTSPSAPPRTVTVVSTTSGSGPGGSHREFVTLRVTHPATLQPVPGATILLQVSAGDLAPLPLLSGANGEATVTWTIAPADQTPGTVQVLAFCSPPPGRSFCRTSLSDPAAVRVPF